MEGNKSQYIVSSALFYGYIPIIIKKKLLTQLPVNCVEFERC